VFCKLLGLGWMAMFFERSTMIGKDKVVEDLIGMIGTINAGAKMRSDRPIGPETFLGADLHLKSLDFVRLAAAIQQHYREAKIPFQKLFVTEEGRIRSDIKIAELAEFLCENIAG
jgi:hypothetical protein